MGKSYGDNHGRDNNFLLVTIYGSFSFIKFGAVGDAIKTFMTDDGEEHSSGETSAADCNAEMYLTDQVQTQAMEAWYALSKDCLPGYKVPGTLLTMGPGNKPVSSQFIEQIFIKSKQESDKDRANPKATTQSIVFSVKGVSRLI